MGATVCTVSSTFRSAGLSPRISRWTRSCEISPRSWAFSPPQAGQLEGLIHGKPELFGSNRLRDVVDGPGLQRGHAGLVDAPRALVEHCPGDAARRQDRADQVGVGPLVEEAAAAVGAAHAHEDARAPEVAERPEVARAVRRFDRVAQLGGSAAAGSEGDHGRDEGGEEDRADGHGETLSAERGAWEADARRARRGLSSHTSIVRIPNRGAEPLA